MIRAIQETIHWRHVNQGFTQEVAWLKPWDVIVFNGFFRSHSCACKPSESVYDGQPTWSNLTASRLSPRSLSMFVDRYLASVRVKGGKWGALLPLLHAYSVTISMIGRNIDNRADFFLALSANMYLASVRFDPALAPLLYLHHHFSQIPFVSNFPNLLPWRTVGHPRPERPSTLLPSWSPRGLAGK